VFTLRSDIMRMVISTLEEERVSYSLPSSKHQVGRSKIQRWGLKTHHDMLLRPPRETISESRGVHQAQLALCQDHETHRFLQSETIFKT